MAPRTRKAKQRDLIDRLEDLVIALNDREDYITAVTIEDAIKVILRTEEDLCFLKGQISTSLKDLQSTIS